MIATAEEVMIATAVMEDTKAAATTALTRITPHHAATITAAWSVQYHSVTAMVHSEVPVTALTTLAVLPPLAVEVLSQVVDHVAL